MRTREEINLYKRNWRLSKKTKKACKKCKTEFIPYRNQIFCTKKCQPNYHKFQYYKICEKCSERYYPSGSAQRKCTRCKSKFYTWGTKKVTMKI